MASCNALNLAKRRLPLSLLVFLSGCRSEGVLDPQGPVAAAERLILVNATAIMLVVVAPVIVLTLAFAWWFRASNQRASYWPDWEYSGNIELTVWSIPTMVVILLAGVGWIGSHQLDPKQPLAGATEPPVRVQVVALDWKWLFIYPDQKLATVNQLIVPTGAPIELAITSGSVMNSFFVPQLGSQIYAMGGMATHLNLMADKAGDYPGLSAQFSGDGFSDMRFIVRAVPRAAFDQWITAAATGTALDACGYAGLTTPGTVGSPLTFAKVDPALFDQIVARTAATAETLACPPPTGKAP
jgi:cytochrome o ubiquinol oxidase subunit 2